MRTSTGVYIEHKKKHMIKIASLKLPNKSSENILIEITLLIIDDKN